MWLRYHSRLFLEILHLQKLFFVPYFLLHVFISPPQGPPVTTFAIVGGSGTFEDPYVIEEVLL